MWFWDGWENLQQVECPNRIDKILTVMGMAASVSDATRLVKGNGVKFKSWLYLGTI